MRLHIVPWKRPSFTVFSFLLFFFSSILFPFWQFEVGIWIGFHLQWPVEFLSLNKSNAYYFIWFNFAAGSWSSTTKPTIEYEREAKRKKSPQRNDLFVHVQKWFIYHFRSPCHTARHRVYEYRFSIVHQIKINALLNRMRHFRYNLYAKASLLGWCLMHIDFRGWKQMRRSRMHDLLRILGFFVSADSFLLHSVLEGSSPMRDRREKNTTTETHWQMEFLLCISTSNVTHTHNSVEPGAYCGLSGARKITLTLHMGLICIWAVRCLFRPNAATEFNYHSGKISQHTIPNWNA